jgi:diphthine synthase
MLYLIGLGLGDVKDITVKGLEIVKNADLVYLEAYTSVLCGGENNQQMLEDFYGREVIIADREFVESDSNKIIEESRDKTIALLVVGDPFGYC